MLFISENVDNQELAAKNDGGTDRPLHTQDERFQYLGETSIVSSLRLEKDDDVVCLREKIHNTEGEYSAASPPYTPSSPTYPPSSPSLPDIYRSTPMPKTPTPDVRASFPNYNLPDVRASFPNYNLIKTYFSSNFVQYIPQNDFGMGFPKYITYKMGNRKMTYYAVNKNN
ncbi:hypothetical protein TNCT_569001 [Trichonephila clavata]|uniref:Uncharacterized protein n=1 Tax=Trichonephila clavata TaxID=2740835 RepID=A0A8X6K776_TRICU|nr:hypothetical protein TNCT_569001 [Trichonephila clavata]